MPAAPTVEGGAAFAVANVIKAYDGQRVVDGISLDFAGGSINALIGSSGSGKSTLLRLLIGLEWPDAGEVRFAGAPLSRRSMLDARRRIGYVIQDGGLFPHLTVLGNLALLPRHLGWAGSRIGQRAVELARLTHLHEDLLRRFPAELSGGQRQRVALMRALMLDPPALLLDEPLGALDPLVRHELQNDLRTIFRDLGKTVVVVTHDLAEAAFFAPRLILLRHGKVLQDGALDDFLQRPADAFVRRFVQARRELPPGATDPGAAA